MTRLPHDVLARLRAKARAERETEEERSGERSKPSFEVEPSQKLEWLTRETLRRPSAGSVDVVKLPRRKRS